MLEILSIFTAIEEMWDFQLPKDYRDFLLRTNGGKPENTLFYIDKEYGESIIDGFFGFKKGLTWNLLLKQQYAGVRVPGNFLPIARECFGNLILLAVKNPDRGKIFFWDHELEAGDGEVPDYSNLTLIAPDFQTFFDSLRSEDDED